jgi:hypothetical protein
MSIPQCLLRNRDVSTPPVDSVPLSFPRRSSRGHQPPVKEETTAAVLFAEENVVAAPAKEKGEGGPV